MLEIFKTGSKELTKNTNEHLETLNEMSDKFDAEAAQRTRVAARIYRGSRLDGNFLSDTGMGHLEDYKSGLNEMIKIEAKTRGSSYENILKTRRGDLSIQEHTARLLNMFDDTFAETLDNAGVSSVSTVAREALKVRDIYRFVGVAEADGFMRNVDDIVPTLGRSYIMDVLSGEDLARAAFSENTDASKKDELRNWGKRIDEKYSVGVSDQEKSPTANLAKMIADTVEKESRSRNKN